MAAAPGADPPALRRLLRRCLCKEIRARVRDFADVRLDIEDAQREMAAARTPFAMLGAWTARHAWLLVPAVTLATAAAVAVSIKVTAPPATHVEQQFDIVTPAVVGASDLGSFAVSPDGSTLAFVGADEGQAHVWIRQLDVVKATPVSGTAGASSPFWSLDGKSIAFYASGRLKRVDLDGGLVRTIAASEWGGGGSWNGDGTILFVRNPAGPILRVGADGSGTVEAVTEVGDREAGHLAPHFLPDGRHFLYFVKGAADKQGIYVSSLVDGRPRKLVDAETAAVFTSGHLLFVRDHTVLAQPFDTDRLTLVGTAFQVASEALGSIHEAGPDAVSAAQNGNLAFRVGNTRPHTRYTWIDRSGRHLGEVGPLDAGISPSASPDLSQLVVLRRTLEESNNDVWAMDTRRGLMTRLTTNPAEDVFPIWSAHGDRVFFSSNRGSRWGLYRIDFSGGSERLLMSSGPEVMFACDESADGRVLVFQRQGATTGWDLWVADPDDLNRPRSWCRRQPTNVTRSSPEMGSGSRTIERVGQIRNLHAVVIGRGNTRAGIGSGRVAGPLACGWARVVLRRHRRHADGGRGDTRRRRGSAGTGGASAALRRTGRHRAVGRGRRPVRRVARWPALSRQRLRPRRAADAHPLDSQLAAPTASGTLIGAAFSTSAGREAPVEPGPRRLPLPGDRRTGERQDGANLLLRQAAEISQFDHAGLPGIEARKLVERLIQQEHFTVGRR